MEHTLIRGGLLVTPEQIRRADILIVGESISEVAPAISDPGARLVSADGLYIFPGLIDAHVHLRDPGATHKEDWNTGTRAALAGGVTTVLDMPNNPRPATSREAFKEKRAQAQSKAVCDYGLFAGATSNNIQDLGQWGAVGIKVYMGATTGDLLLTNFGSLYRHFASNLALPIVVHAEDNEALQYFGREPSRSRHSDKRPPLAASLAVARALALAEATKHPLHIAHASTAGELALVKAAKERGVMVTCEVTPQHLFLSTEDETRLRSFGIVNPPLRSPEEVRALWEHRDDWNMVATDHAPHTIEEKQSVKPPSGMPGLETMLPLLLDAAHQGRLSLRDISRLTAREPARVFHLSRKGELAPGYDADLTLVDLNANSVLQKPWQTKCNWSPFEGLRVKGKIARVFLRGRQVMANGEISAEAGCGREVQRSS